MGEGWGEGMGRVGRGNGEGGEREQGKVVHKKSGGFLQGTCILSVV